MKKFPCLLILLLAAWLQADDLYQTPYTNTVGPGVVHKKIIAPSVPWELDVVEIDLTNPHISITSVHGKDLVVGRETTSSMSRRNNYEGHWSVSALNADFFDADGTTINAQVIDGEMVKNENVDPANPTYWSTVNITTDNIPSITRNLFQSFVITAGGEKRAINSVNRTRYADHLVFYNSYMGTSTGTNKYGTEILLQPVGSWVVNDTVTCVAEAIEASAGSMVIPAGKVVLSGHGTASTFLTNQVKSGDTLQVCIGLKNAPENLMTLVGGFPRIVKNGQNYAYAGYAEEGGTATFHTDRHPRTGVGISADNKTLFFITVDGRQEHSIGMNLIELADFMIGIGVAQGVNLDGGGSTTMVVRNVVKNSPSDGSERAVGNALLALSSAPEGTLSHIQIEPDNGITRLNETIQFQTSGWDEYYNPLTLNASNVHYSVDSTLGTVMSSGIFTAKANGASGYVYNHYGVLKDSAYVYIKAIKSISMEPEFCVTDTLSPVVFQMTGIDEDDSKLTMSNASFRWECTNPEVGSISTDGIFTGKKEGTAKIRVYYGDLRDSAEVRVETGTNTVVLEGMDSTEKWNLDGMVLDTLNTVMSAVDTPRTAGEKSIRVDYRFVKSSTEYSWLFLDTDIEVYGVPEFIKLDFRGDGNAHKIYIIAADNDGELFRASVRPFQRNTVFETIAYPTSSFLPVEEGNFHYPIRIRRIEIKLGTSVATGDTARGTLYFDNLRVSYPLATELERQGSLSIPDTHHLYQNYPNPFNAGTTIRYTVGSRRTMILPGAVTQHVELAIFNVMGQKIKTLVSERQPAGEYTIRWDASDYPSGLYYCRLCTDRSFAEAKKLVLMK